jgi:hypothetical protein
VRAAWKARAAQAVTAAASPTGLSGLAVTGLYESA